MTVEKRDIEIDRNIAIHHIYSQAGSPEKAVSEAIMNAVDAEATEIRIEIADNGVDYRIIDNGRGFAGEDEIKKCFGKLGFDHKTEIEQAKNRTFGQFGLGRAQLWCWSRNTWQSGPFRMSVDIEAHGLTYELKKDAEPVDGCTIVGEFFKPITIAELADLRRRLKDLTQYMPITIYFNGDVISKPVADMKWDKVTDEAYFRFTQYGGIKIYNQGMYVCTHPASYYGISGIVISRGNLTLNVARNDIMRNRCELFPAITATLKEQAKKLGKKKSSALTAQDRMALLVQYLEDPKDNGELFSRKLIKGVNGRHYGIDQLAEKFNGRLSVADRNNSTAGETAIETGDTLVMSPDFFNTMDTSPEDFVEDLNIAIEKQFHNSYFGRPTKISLIDYKELAEALNASVVRDDEAKLPRRPKVTLKALRTLNEAVARLVQQQESHGLLLVEREAMTRTATRTLYPGKLDGAMAWTDGARTLGFDLDHAHKMLQRGLKGFQEAYLVLIHEYCHKESSQSDHSHGLEFYKLFHDLAMDAPYRIEDVKRAMQLYAKEHVKADLTIPSQVARDISKAEAGNIEKLLEKKELEAH